MEEGLQPRGGEVGAIKAVIDTPFSLTFPEGPTVPAMRVGRMDALPAALRALGLPFPRPVVVLIGGASGLEPEMRDRLGDLFARALAAPVAARNAVIVDGATDSGVMHLIGQARRSSASGSDGGSPFPLVGVAAEGTVILPGAEAAEGDGDRAPLEPNHSHFVLVPGTKWGDESPWIARVATVLAGPSPSVAVLCNGGEVSWTDVRCNALDEGRPVIVLAGSGRTADALAQATTRGAARLNSERARLLVASGRLHVWNLEEEPDALAGLLSSYLLRPADGNEGSRAA